MNNANRDSRSTKDTPHVWLIDAPAKGDTNNSLCLAERLDPNYDIVSHAELKRARPCASRGPISLTLSRADGNQREINLTPDSLPDIIIDSGGEQTTYILGLVSPAPSIRQAPLLVCCKLPDCGIAFYEPVHTVPRYRYPDMTIGYTSSQVRKHGDTGLPAVMPFYTQDIATNGCIDEEEYRRSREANLVVYDALGSRVNDHVLTTAAAAAKERLAPFTTNHPIYMVAIAELTAGQADELADYIAEALDQTGGSVLFTDSPRTFNSDDIIAIFRERLGKHIPLFVNEAMSDHNDYWGMLAIADKLVVTNDSLSMIADAIATRKPTYIYPYATQDIPNKQYARIQQSAGHLLPIRTLAAPAPKYIHDVDNTQKIVDDIVTAWERKKNYIAALECAPEEQVTQIVAHETLRQSNGKNL